MDSGLRSTPPGSLIAALRSRTYVEEVEYPEMVFGPDGFWACCGYCGWDCQAIRDTRRAAELDRWRHPNVLCWLKALWIDNVVWRLNRV